MGRSETRRSPTPGLCVPGVWVQARWRKSLCQVSLSPPVTNHNRCHNCEDRGHRETGVNHDSTVRLGVRACGQEMPRSVNKDLTLLDGNQP